MDAKSCGASNSVMPSNNVVFFITRSVSFEVAHLIAEGTAFDSLGCQSQGMMPITFPSSQPRSTAYAIDRVRGRSRLRRNGMLAYENLGLASQAINCRRFATVKKRNFKTHASGYEKSGLNELAEAGG